MSYTISLIDRCCEISSTIRYHNTTSMPISVTLVNDTELDMGYMFCLESSQDGAEQVKYQPNTPIKSTSVELLPQKEMVLHAKYIKEVPYSDRTFSVKIPFKGTLPTGTEIKVDGQFSTIVRSVKCPTHPASLNSLNIDDNKLNAIYQITQQQSQQHSSDSNSESGAVIRHFWVNVETQELPTVCGWTSDAVSYEGALIRSSMVSFNTNTDVNNVVLRWMDQSETRHSTLTRGTVLYNLEKLDASTKAIDNIATLAYNEHHNCRIQLQSTSSMIIYRFTTLSKLRQIEDSKSSQQDISYLIKLFLENNSIRSPESSTPPATPSSSLSDSTNSSPFSSLSFSAPDNSSTNNGAGGRPSLQSSFNSLQTSGDLLTNLSQLPRAKPPSLQSFTAPPSFNKDLSNPIAAFVSNRQLLGSSSGPSPTQAKSKRAPPSLLSTVNASRDGGPPDLRQQRMASYNKINQMFGKPTKSDFTRTTIPLDEIEPVAFDIALQHIRTQWWNRPRLSTQEEIQMVRSIVQSVITSDKIEMTYVIVRPSPAASPSGSVSDLKSLLAPKSPPPVQEGEKQVDAERLKWIIEEVLNGERHRFPAADSQTAFESWCNVCIGETVGMRPQMEDKHVFIEHPDCLYGTATAGQATAPEKLYVGVFDGHNGSVAAEYAKINLGFEIFKQRPAMTSADQVSRVKDAYLAVDKSFLALAEKDERKAGTTVATAIIHRDRIMVSNVGDTEVVLCSGGIAMPLTTQHTPHNDLERKRIESGGGMIIQYGTLRVNGVLSVTRAVGDRNLKEFVIADPDTIVHTLTKQDQFIIMATDGLWDVFTYQEASDFILSNGKSTGTSSSSSSSSSPKLSSTTSSSSSSSSSSSNSNSNSNNNSSNGSDNNNNNNNNMVVDDTSSSQPKSIADKIIQEAMNRHSRDNITVAIVFFRDNYQPPS
ncbi:hypothetical protein SAMD00019534_096270 [Acytostelium subglobosum LB1]|uniref:hypothetical protein n=1 Tax=Acytostelium subglobosum LB1 TaxID=1410327 RepID=UPI0006448B85|nr:hypothetical protein SAMD00019534_096270 [Acytostelium subglobosum LB1]GAM26452.1 hypothetical protein SAMD00019534_096270 [Acytostelium subglobosum LB1]|eukprot:XP_012750548.1 hypothetical protein SAMD00019534_096270 [Acytostelium subglobosum LB1]